MIDDLETLEMISVADARKEIKKHIDQASKHGIRIGITNHGKPVAAIVPFSDAALLEKQDSEYFQKLEHEEIRKPTYVGSPEAEHISHIPSNKHSASLLGRDIAIQVRTRIIDSQLTIEQPTFNAIVEIVQRTVQDTLDRNVLPNPSEELKVAVNTPTVITMAHGATKTTNTIPPRFDYALAAQRNTVVGAASGSAPAIGAMGFIDVLSDPESELGILDKMIHKAEDTTSKQRFIGAIAGKCDCTQAQAATFFEAFAGTIISELKQGNEFNMPGFGKFIVKHELARKLHSSATGKTTADKPKTSIPSFLTANKTL